MEPHLGPRFVKSQKLPPVWTAGPYPTAISPKDGENNSTILARVQCASVSSNKRQSPVA